MLLLKSMQQWYSEHKRNCTVAWIFGPLLVVSTVNICKQNFVKTL